MSCSFLRHTDMARVDEGSYSFTCHPHDYLQVEWTIPAFTPQLQGITALWLVLSSPPTEGRKLSWPGWLDEIMRWFAHPKTVAHSSISRSIQESNSRPSSRKSNALTTESRAVVLRRIWSTEYLLLLADQVVMVCAGCSGGVTELMSVLPLQRDMMLSVLPTEWRTSSCKNSLVNSELFMAERPQSPSLENPRFTTIVIIVFYSIVMTSTATRPNPI